MLTQAAVSPLSQATLRVLQCLPSQDSVEVLGFLLEDTSVPLFHSCAPWCALQGDLGPLLMLLGLEELPAKKRSVQPLSYGQGRGGGLQG